MARSTHHPGSISELLEPAIDGPPSPESIRALSNQMRWASAAEKHQSHHSRQSHQTTSSGSSSLRSLTSADRPSWDTNFDGSTSLSRKSSGRSINSMQLRERHDSVQIFGKTLFGKRGRLRRESSAQSSSNSSLYSAETPYEKGGLLSAPPPPPPPPPSTSHGLATSSSKEALIPSFFNRRRAAKSGPPSEDLDGRRRLQISGPYNFQHLTHTQREQLPGLHRGSRGALQSDFVSAQSCQSPNDGALHGIQAHSLHFPNFSSEELPLAERGASPNVSHQYATRSHASSVSSMYPPPRTVFHTRSQDQLRIPPPRPPRSPIESSSFSPPVPPPRISSRVSIRYGEFESSSSTPTERPQTSGGFRQTMLLGRASPDAPRPLTHAHSYSADMSMSSADTRRFSQMPDAITAMPSAVLDDANWPLTCPTSSTATFDILPEVPEEEEHTYNHRNSVRKSRMSIASNASSLRKSHSVPLLQQFAQTQTSGSQRPPSGASDTLGRYDLFAAQRALRETVANENENDDAASLQKASWEDDIDYCYEHEIEADCEYAWDRPSMDLTRDESTTGADVAASDNRMQCNDGAARRNVSPNMLGPGCFDVPALSPASQASTASISGAVTPTGLTMRRSPGLTIQTKIGDDELRPMHKFFHGRSTSRGSRASFRESYGFNLSPSLFIPGTEKYDRYHLPARGAPVGFAIGADDEDEFPAYLEPTMNMDTSTLLIPTRSSASTTASAESRDSVLSDRHISATSTATDLTRLTMSTASIEDLMYKKEHEAPQAHTP